MEILPTLIKYVIPIVSVIVSILGAFFLKRYSKGKFDIKVTKDGVSLVNKDDYKSIVDSKQVQTNEEFDEWTLDVEIMYGIKKMLNKIREEYQADRVYIAEFHNGGRFYRKNRPMQKFTISVESCSAGISSISVDFKDRLVSTYIYFFKHLFKDELFFYPNVGDITEELVKEGLRGYGVKSMYSLAIRDIDSNPVGFITLHYVKRSKKLSDDELENLKADVSKVIGYLDANYIAKNKKE